MKRGVLISRVVAPGVNPWLGGVALFISIANLLFAGYMALSYGGPTEDGRWVFVVLTPQVLALFLAAFGRGSRVGKAALALSAAALVGFPLLMFVLWQAAHGI